MKSFLDSFYTTGVVALMLLLAGPAAIYAGNPNDFTFRFGDVLPALVIAAVLLAALTALPLSLLRGRIFRAATAVGCGTALMLWAQAAFLQWRYGPLNGKSIEWTSHTRRAHVEAAIWVVALIVCLVAAEAIFRRRTAIRTVLLAMTALSFVSQLGPLFQSDKPEFVVGESDKFTFSSQRNVIVLVLDTYQTDVFHQLLNERPDLRQVFQGFTYYRNALGGFSLTLPSLPLMLTGQYYDNSVPYRDFLKRIYAEESVPGVLLRAGYKVDLFPSSQAYLAFDPSIASNAMRGVSFATTLRYLSELIDLSAFRYAPLSLKRYVYADDRWMTRRWLPERTSDSDLGFFGQMSARAKVASEPRFKLFHLRGMHAPLAYDQNLVPRTFPLDDPSYKQQARGLMTLLQRFLADIRKLGIYDKSMIVIAGDHGTSGYSLDVNVEASGHRQEWRAGHVPAAETDIVESGIPLMLIKPFASSADLQISDAPVTHADLPKTITDAAGVPAFTTLSSMRDIGEHADRRRRFLSYAWEQKLEDAAYFPPLNEYWVSGFSWLRSSWEPSFKTFTEGGTQTVRPAALSMPATLDFGAPGNVAEYLGLGWAFPETSYRWTDGSRSAVIVPLKTATGPLRIKMSLTPLIVPGKLASQRVRLLADGRFIREWNVEGPGNYEAVFPQEVTDDGELTIELDTPDSASPADLGLSTDSRRLGVAVSRVHLEALTPYEIGTAVRFGQAGNAAQFEAAGWAAADADYTWTEGRRATLEIPVRSAALTQLTVSLTPLVDARTRAVQRVIVKAGGRVVDTWNVGGSGSYSTTIPPELFGRSMLQLTFELPDAITPKALNGTADPRLLGVAFAALTLSPAAPYEYGALIRFGKDANNAGYRPTGWAVPDPDFTWTEGSEATLTVPVRNAGRDLTLTASVTPLLAAPQLQAQRVEVRVGNVLIGTWRLTAGGEYRMTIPASAASSGLLRLQFRLPDAATPLSLGLSNDSRRLGVAFGSVKIS